MRAAILFLALLAPSVAGCLEGRGDRDMGLMERSVDLEFRGRGEGFAARLAYIGTGTVVGPDLEIHPAERYELQEALPLKGVTTTSKWTIGVVPGTFSVLSFYTDCTTFDLDDGTCTGGETIHVPVAEDALPFQAALIGPLVPPEDGPFLVPLWDAERIVEVPFSVATRGDVREARAAKVAVEHGDIEARGSSGGSPLECDPFEGDVLLLRSGSFGCREAAKAWEWWMPRPLEEYVRLAEPAPAYSSARLPPTHPVERGVPRGSELWPFPLDDALTLVRARTASPVFEDPDWRLSSFDYFPSGAFSVGNPAVVTCEEHRWRLAVTTPDGTSMAASASRRTCDGGLVLEERVEQEGALVGQPWPDAPKLVDLQAVVDVGTDLLCIEDLGGFSVGGFTRRMDGANRTWISARPFPRGATGMSMTWVTFDGASGRVLALSDSTDADMRARFEAGLSGRCARE